MRKGRCSVDAGACLDFDRGKTSRSECRYPESAERFSALEPASRLHPSRRKWVLVDTQRKRSFEPRRRLCPRTSVDRSLHQRRRFLSRSGRAGQTGTSQIPAGDSALPVRMGFCDTPKVISGDRVTTAPWSSRLRRPRTGARVVIRGERHRPAGARSRGLGDRASGVARSCRPSGEQGRQGRANRGGGEQQGAATSVGANAVPDIIRKAAA
jgi:hypothetical protein